MVAWGLSEQAPRVGAVQAHFPIEPDSYPGLSARRVELRRSRRRHRTVSARVEGDSVIVMMPANLPAHEEQAWVDRMLTGLARSQQRRRAPSGDSDLQRRAVALAAQWLDGPAGQPVRPHSVRWVTNQNTRWGSCTSATGDIRLSDRLRAMPAWVVDYVLLHELTHLVETMHTQRFRALLARFPTAERAEGYLLGWSAGRAGLMAESPGAGFWDDEPEPAECDGR